jgi:hypothetical protein
MSLHFPDAHRPADNDQRIDFLSARQRIGLRHHDPDKVMIVCRRPFRNEGAIGVVHVLEIVESHGRQNPAM